MRTPHTARRAEFVWDLVYHITKATLSVYLMQKRETGCFCVSQKSRQKTAHEDVWKAPGLREPRGTVPRDHDTQPMRGEVPRVEIKKPLVGTELSDLETTASWPFPSGRPGLRRPGTAGAPVHTLSGAPVRSPRAPGAPGTRTALFLCLLQHRGAGLRTVTAGQHDTWRTVSDAQGENSVWRPPGRGHSHPRS